MIALEKIVKISPRLFLRVSALIVALSAVSALGADIYPSRPVRMIVPFAPGGQVDAIGRLLAQKLSGHFDKQFYVENISGAGGNIGMGRAAQSPPDGYTVLVVEATSFVANPVLYAKPPYDPYKDFDPITPAASTTQLLTIHPSLPVRTVQELAEAVRANPGKYSYSSPGVGTGGHLMGE